MKSMSDLMLQAHFKELKKELDKSLKQDKTRIEDINESLFKEIYNYLKIKSKESSLDDKGLQLLEKIAKRLDELNSDSDKQVRRKEFEKSIPEDFKLRKKGA